MTKQEFIKVLESMPDNTEIYVANHDLADDNSINDTGYYEPMIEAWDNRYPMSHWIIYPDLSKLVSG